MKRILYAITCVAIAFGCANNESGEVSQMRNSKPADTATALYAVPLSVALANMAYYDTIVKNQFNKKIPIRAFTIRAVDLLEALGMPSNTVCQDSAKYNHVRLYLGMDTLRNFKLYLTPVVGANLSASPPSAGEDFYLSGKFKGEDKFQGDGKLLGENDQYMLDFSSPCPNTCPQ